MMSGDMTAGGYPYTTLPMHSDELGRVPPGMNGMYSGLMRPVVDPVSGTWTLPGTPTNPAITVAGSESSPRTNGGTHGPGDGYPRSMMYPFGFGASPSGSQASSDPIFSQEVTEMAIRGGFGDFNVGVRGGGGGGGGGGGNSSGFFGSGASNMFGFDSPMSDGSRQVGQEALQMSGITDTGGGTDGGGFADMLQGLIGQGGPGAGNGSMGDTSGQGGVGAGQTPSRGGSGQGSSSQVELEDVMKMWSGVPSGFEYVSLPIGA